MHDPAALATGYSPTQPDPPSPPVQPSVTWHATSEPRLAAQGPSSQALQDQHLAPLIPDDRSSARNPVATATGPLTSPSPSILARDRSRRDVSHWCRVWGPWLAGCLTILVGVGCSVGLYFWFRSVETGTFQRDFRTIRRICARSLESVMGVRCFQHLRNFAAFTYATPELTQAAVTTFGERSSFDPKIIYSINVLVIVPKHQSAAVSKFYQLPVWDSSNSTTLTRSDNVSVYPVFIHPNNRGSNFMGWNLLSDPIRRVPVLRALTPGRWGISKPMVFRDSGVTGFAAWHHVPSRAPTAVTPFPQFLASVSLSFSLLFTSTLDRILRNANESDVAVYVSDRNHERVFAYEPSEGPTVLDSSRTAADTFQGFDAEWTVTFVPSTRYVSKFFTAVPWVVFACTLGVFILLSDVVRRATSKFILSKQMMQRLELQTKLLGSMQQYSRAVLEAIPDGLLMLDGQGRIMSANDAALQMTGYHLDDFVNPVPFANLLVEPNPPSQDDEGRHPERMTSGHDPSLAESASNDTSRRTSIRRRRNRTVDPATTPATDVSATPPTTPLSRPTTALTTAIEIDHDPVAVDPVRSMSRQTSTESTRTVSNPSADPVMTLLEPGDHEVTMRRKDGSTFIAQLSVSEVNDAHVDPDAPIGDLLSLNHRMRTMSTHTRVSASSPTPSSPMQASLMGSESFLPLAGPNAPHDPTFHQIVLFHDITARVEAMRLVAAMEKQAMDATAAKQHLLRFLIQAMTVPVHQMMQDLEVIARAANDSVDMADAKAAAKHIVNVLDDVALYAGVGCVDQQAPQQASGSTCGLDSDLVMPQGACPRCGGCGSQGKLLRELVDKCIEPDLVAALRAQGTTLTVSVGQPSANKRIPPGFACTVCKLIHKFVALGVMAARPSSLMTLAVNVEDLRVSAMHGDSPLSPPIRASSAEQQCADSARGSGSADTVVQFLVTLSAFDSQLPRTTVAHDLSLSIGSRGSTFGNVALTWAAVIQLVLRNHGHIQQTRVAPGSGLVVSVTLPVPV